MSDFSPSLEAFCLELRTSAGQYAIVAARTQELQLVAREILDAEHGVLVHWGAKHVRWPSGAIAYLIPATPRGAEQLRGMLLDGAWFISGGIDELYLPQSMVAYTLTRTARGDFKTWQTYL